MTVGYARVSTSEQNISTQIEMLREIGCEKVFTDIASGVREDRVGLNDMLSYLRKDDIIIVYKTDCTFRSLKNMIDLIEKFNEKGILFKSITVLKFKFLLVLLINVFFGWTVYGWWLSFIKAIS